MCRRVQQMPPGVAPARRRPRRRPRPAARPSRARPPGQHPPPPTGRGTLARPSVRMVGTPIATVPRDDSAAAPVREERGVDFPGSRRRRVVTVGTQQWARRTPFSTNQSVSVPRPHGPGPTWQRPGLLEPAAPGGTPTVCVAFSIVAAVWRQELLRHRPIARSLVCLWPARRLDDVSCPLRHSSFPPLKTRNGHLYV